MRSAWGVPPHWSLWPCPRPIPRSLFGDDSFGFGCEMLPMGLSEVAHVPTYTPAALFTDAGAFQVGAPGRVTPIFAQEHVSRYDGSRYPLGGRAALAERETLRVQRLHVHPPQHVPKRRGCRVALRAA